MTRTVLPAGAYARRLTEVALASEGAPDQTVMIASPIATPLGLMLAAATDRGLRQFSFVDSVADATGDGLPAQLERLAKRWGGRVRAGAHPCFAELTRQLEEYFAGRRRAFDVPLDRLGTSFQLQVWAQLEQIPHGATCSYGEQAQRLGRSTAVRAVAAANGRNPIAILVPCHRVIGKDGRLTGYSGGLWRKRWLLTLESRGSERAQS